MAGQGRNWTYRAQTRMDVIEEAFRETNSPYGERAVSNGPDQPLTISQ